MRFIKLKFSIISIIISFSVFAQEDNVSNDVKTFFMDSDELGQVENSVNLFNGEINLPIGLINIPGRGGLNTGVTLIYNSNIEEIVNTWNLELPTGILGLGWSIEVPKIVVDNKLTGARDDDEFYLMDGGLSNRLYCVRINGDGTREYETEQFAKWSILYDKSNERWTIIKEDGTTYIYGDDDLDNGSAIEYILHWDNWIGNSSNYSSSYTSRQGLVWNLAKIQNRWGDAVTFKYKKVERFVKNGTGIRHTEASYLVKVTSPTGYTINFIDMPKEPREYQDPNTEVQELDNSDGTGGSTGDAYQERYEKRYLGNIEVKDPSNSDVYSFQFVYDVPNNGDLTKRLLTSIVQKNKDGATFPSIDFSYKTSGNKKGALEKVIYPKGGEVIYHYNETGVSLGYSDRDLTIDAPVGHSEPKVWCGENFVAVAWRELDINGDHVTSDMDVIYKMYEWDGGWQTSSSSYTVSDVEMYLNTGIGSPTYEYIDFDATAGKDYFAVFHYKGGSSGTLRLHHKKAETKGEWWDVTTKTIYVSEMPQLISGNEFVGTLERNGEITVYRWDGDSWEGGTTPHSGVEFYGVGGNNYVICNDENNDAIYFRYLNEEKVWQSVSVPSGYGFASDKKSIWYPSNSFAFVMTGDDGSTNKHEFAYHWDENYNFSSPIDIFNQHYPNGTVYITNNNLICLNSSDVGARYNGITWDTYKPSLTQIVSVANDYLLTSFSSGSFREVFATRYLPNTLSWSNQFLMNYSNIPGLYARNGYSVVRDDNNGQKVFLRDSDNTYSSIYDYETNPPDDFLYTVIYPNHLISEEPTTLSTSDKIYYRELKNGTVQQSIYMGSQRPISNRQMALEADGYDIMITYNSYDAVGQDFMYETDATQLTLWKFLDDGISGDIVEYPVEGIEINSGSDSKYISISYDVTKGLYCENSKGAMYNKVVVTHKDNSTGGSSFGKTEYYFFNGLNYGESATTFPNSGSGIDTEDGALKNYKRFLGKLYLKKLIEGTSTVVREEKTTWRLIKKPILNSSSIQIAMGYMVRPHKTEVTANSIAVVEDYSYDNSTGNLTYRSSTNSEGKTIVEDYYYLHEITDADYNFAEAENLYASTVQTKRTVGGVTLDAYVVDWTTGETVNYPKENYVWDGTGTFSDFSFGSSTHTNWRKVSTVTDVDNYGNVIETRDEINDTYHAKIMGYDHSLPVGFVNNATYAKSFIDVFDDENLTKWTGIGDSDGDTNWSVYDEQLKLINYASASSGECDRLYLNLGTEVTSVVVFEFDVTIANSNNWDLTIGLGGDGWATGNGGTENAVWTAINDETWYYYTGAWNTIKSGLTVGKKYHFKIVAKPSANKADFYVDGVKYISDGNFRSFSSGIQKAAFGNYGYGTVTTTWYLDNVRLYPSNADIVSYDYKPLIGKTSETDINNQKVTYSYDLFDRLETVHDGNGNILEHIEYSFKGNGEIGMDPPALDASPSSLSPSYGSGSSNVTITANVNWVTSISSGDEDWLSVTPASGNNDGTIAVAYTQNSSTGSRNGTITLAGEGLTETVNVTQVGAPASLTVSPSAFYFEYGINNGDLVITSNIPWTISVTYYGQDSGWLSFSSTSGTGNATVNVDCSTSSQYDDYREAQIAVQGGGITRYVWVEYNDL
ncbi:MAG: hypothetical protein MI975_09050 [Cytophagales bacterium]|nr:hypothetical protein [Cytophagales bacterium]